MSKVTVITIEQIKTAAKRLAKSFPEKKHTELLDIASYAFAGKKDFREAQAAIKTADKTDCVVSLDNKQSTLTPTKVSSKFGVKHFGESPTLNCGDWYYYRDNEALVFLGEYSPYPIGLNRLHSGSALMDFTLQLHKKYWPEVEIEGTDISATYQVDEFLALIGKLCIRYFRSAPQGVFCPGGKNNTVDWAKAIENEKLADVSNIKESSI